MPKKISNSIFVVLILILIFVGAIQILASFEILPNDLNLLPDSDNEITTNNNAMPKGSDALSLSSSTSRHPVTEDFFNLYSKRQLPRALFSLKNIEWNYYDPDLKNLIPQDSIPFKTSKDGQFKLLIDAFSAPQAKSKISIIQLNIIEIKSGNKVWELSRNYEFQNSK